MSELKYLQGMVFQAERQPRRFLQKLRQYPPDEAFEMLQCVRNPAVRIFGYTSVARRDKDRSSVIENVAGAMEELPQNDRVQVLLALKRMIPTKEQDLMRQIVEALQPQLPKHEFKQLQSLSGSSKGKTFDLGRARKNEWRRLPYEIVEKFSDPASIEEAVDSQRPWILRQKATDGFTSVLTVKPTIIRDFTLKYGETQEFSQLAPEQGASENLLPASVVDVPSAERVVSSGFATQKAPETPSAAPLDPAETYWYWIEIGAPVERSLETERVPLQDFVGPDMSIEVVLFTSDDGVVLVGPSSGAFVVSRDNSVRIGRAAARPDVSAALRQRRMFFQVQIPGEAKLCTMRCNFYCNGVLIQSRMIRMPIGGRDLPRVTVDYVLSRTLNASHLAALETPRLSLMLNENADGTHAFRFYSEGTAPFQNSVHLSEIALQNLIDRARGALRKVSWGSETEWDPEKPAKYLYDSPGSVDTFLPDLIELAKRGRAAWDVIVDLLGRGPDGRDALELLMRKSGQVQFALKESAGAVVPIAMFYDYPLETAYPNERYTLCPGFTKTLSRHKEFENEPCFNGECPSLAAKDIICPGGFWGFRHAIGVPVSIGSQQDSPPDTPIFVAGSDASLSALLSLDPLLVRRDEHVNALREMLLPLSFRESKTRDAAIEAMKTDGSSVIYFYCHGGDDSNDGPYLKVGAPTEPWIARNTFGLEKIRWKNPRPLVFINGCHTTNVEPERAINLVSVLSSVGASGVIGSEITIFESLAVRFAEVFFHEFVIKRRSAGMAVRHARLSILKESLNPLGLVYIPFLLPSLMLRAS